MGLHGQPLGGNTQDIHSVMPDR